MTHAGPWRALQLLADFGVRLYSYGKRGCDRPFGKVVRNGGTDVNLEEFDIVKPRPAGSVNPKRRLDFQIAVNIGKKKRIRISRRSYEITRCRGLGAGQTLSD
jgi:hypothetical protein